LDLFVGLPANGHRAQSARIGADISNNTTAVIRHIMLSPFGESKI
jgi:hypothetical protein